ncbi:MAG: DUF5011 domain-containing protein [bacterium]|nr:DUF5011 domain-containing protein [bacterium]
MILALLIFGISGELAAQQPGPVAHYPGDGTTEDVVRGIAGEGTLFNGATYQDPGVFGQAFSFDGQDDYFEAPLTQQGPFSVSLWVYAGEVNQAAATGVLSTANGTPVGSFQIDFDGSGNYQFNSLQQVSGTLQSELVAIGPAASSFQHIVVAYDGTTVSTYLNGHFKNSASISVARFDLLRLAANRVNNARFNGFVDDVRIFDYELSETQVADLAARPVAHYPGEGNGNDVVGGVNGTVSGAAYSPGVVGQSFDFDGNNDYFESSFTTTAGSPFTVSLWVNAGDINQARFSGILSTSNGPNAAGSFQIDFDGNASGNGNYRFHGTDGDTYDKIIGPALKDFQHLAVTYENSTITLYLNGQPTGTQNYPDAQFYLLKLGRNRRNNTYFEGLVDEVKIYDRALSAETIAELAGTDVNPPVAVATAPSPVECTGPNGAEVTLGGSGSSDPNNDPLTYTWYNGDTIIAGPSANPTSTVTLPLGDHTITLEVSNGVISSVTDIHVIVEDTVAPVLTVPADVTLEDPADIQPSNTGLATATDVCDPNPAIAYSDVFVGTPPLGVTTRTWTATDASGNASSGDQTITVIAANDPPVATDSSVSGDEDTEITGQADAQDSDADPLTFTLTQDVNNGQLTLNSDGTFSYTPNPEFSGNDAFSFTASDGEATSNEATVSITVNPVNDPPILKILSRPVVEGNGFADFTSADLLATDPDNGPAELTYEITQEPQGGSLKNASGPLGVGNTFTQADLDNGGIRYTNTDPYIRSDLFYFTLTDGENTLLDQYFKFSVTPPPIVANDDDYETDVDQPLTVQAPGVLGNDDNLDPRSSARVYELPAYGTVQLNPDGSFTYTPDPSFVGTDQFTYQIVTKATKPKAEPAPQKEAQKAEELAKGDPGDNIGTVTITVNYPIVAVDDEYDTFDNTPLTVEAPGVLDNDQNPGRLRLLAQVIDQPVSGTLEFNYDGSFTYTPNPDFVGDDQFTYQAFIKSKVAPKQQKKGAQAAATKTAPQAATQDDIATVTIHVLQSNLPPIAICQDIDLDLDANGQATLDPAQIDNGSSDPEGGPLTLSVTPNAFTCENLGPNTVTLTVTDDHDVSVTCEAIVTVKDVTPPAITLTGAAEITLECGIDEYTEEGATVTDICDPNAEVVIAGSVDLTALGDYTITYNAIDASGNEADEVTRIVHVVDTTAPVITLTGDADITLECGIDTYTEQGATVTDNCDPNVEIVTSGSVDLTALGDYTITYNATDESGNVATEVTRTVHVVDTTPPVITLTGDDDITLECGVDTYTEEGATVTDHCDPNVEVVIAGSVDLTALGDYTITYNATDASGNVATEVTRTVHVVDTTDVVWKKWTRD